MTEPVTQTPSTATTHTDTVDGEARQGLRTFEADAASIIGAPVSQPGQGDVPMQKTQDKRGSRKRTGERVEAGGADHGVRTPDDGGKKKRSGLRLPHFGKKKGGVETDVAADNIAANIAEAPAPSAVTSPLSQEKKVVDSYNGMSKFQAGAVMPLVIPKKPSSAAPSEPFIKKMEDLPKPPVVKPVPKPAPKPMPVVKPTPKPMPKVAPKPPVVKPVPKPAPKPVSVVRPTTETLLRELEITRDIIGESRRQVESDSSQISNLDTEINDLDGRQTLIKDKLSPLVERERSLTREIEALEESELKSSSREEKRLIEQKRWEKEAERHTFEDKKWEVDELIEKLDEIIDEKKDLRSELIGETTHLRHKIQKSEARTRVLETEVTLNQIISRHEELNRSERVLDQQLESISKELAKVGGDEHSVEDEKRTIDNKLQVATSGPERRELERSRRELENKRRETEKKRWGLEDQKKDLETKLEETKRASTATKTKVEAVKTKLKKMQPAEKPSV